MGQKIKDGKWKCLLRKVFIILFWLLVWHLLAIWVDNSILLVTPVQAIVALWELLWEVKFWQTIGISLVRIGAGFGLGAMAALLLAAVSSRFRLLEEILSPIMTLCKAVPVASFVVLLLIWWGSSFLAVAICFLMVLPNIYISTLEGLKNTDKKLLEMAEVFGMPLSTRFFYMYRPALRPFLDSSLKLSLGMCWKSGVAAEVIGTPDFSIGERLYMSKIYLDTAGVFAWTAVIILLSIGFERAVLWLVGRFFVWEPACGECARSGASLGKGYHKKYFSGNSGKGLDAENAGEQCAQGRKNEKEQEKNEEKGGIQKDDIQSGIQKSGIQIRNVSKSYGSKQVITEFSALYENGNTYYLTSPSGSGKTTLLRLLCRLERPDGGSIQPKLQCSMVFQEDRLCEDYSALRNVEMVTGSREQAIAALQQLLEEDALYKPCSQLSGGMKRRVALVRAMESASDMVLLDEPFTGMDADTRSRAEDYIREKQRGRVLIIATHI